MEQIEGPLIVLRETQVNLMTDIAGTLAEMGDASEADRKRLTDIARDLHELFFLVVVIGEFNAGKSTFVNALLQDDVLPTGITPTTEVIELIRYSETPNPKPRLHENNSIREWQHPNTGAPGVAIVDTPGTGSVFQQHEKVAKDFLHRSDLVIFLLSAKRAFAETERIYLEMAKNYGKKVILVVNQTDLLEPEEKDKVRRFIEQQVKEHLSIQPLMFMISAKQARESQKALSNDEKGGVDAVRAHLRGVFAEAPPAKQKMLSQLETATTINKRYLETIQKKADLIKADAAKVREVETELKEQSLGLDAQLTSARAEVDKVFVGMRQRGITFIDANLSIRKVGRSVNREKLQAEFQDVVIGRALRDINDATSGYINAVVDQSRLYWRSVIDRLNKMVELLEQEEIGGLDANVYAEQRESLEEAIRIAEAELRSYSSGRLVEEIQQEFQVNMSGFTTGAITSVGGLAIMLIAAGTPGPLFGAGAAALAGPAFIFAVPFAAWGSVKALQHYRKITSDIKKDFNTRVDRLMNAYHTALDDLTRKERSRLAQYGNQVLTPIFSRLEVLSKRYAEQQGKLEKYQERANTLRKGIEGS